MYKGFDFECICGEVFEDLVNVSKDTARSTVTAPCPKCGKEAPSLFSAPGLATFTLMSKEMREDHLKRRSEKHTEKYLK